MTNTAAWRSGVAACAIALSTTACAQTGVMTANGVDLTPPDPAPTTRSRAADCDRACLEGVLDAYLAAVVDDAPDAAPLAADVRFTENGQLLALGEGLWNSMKAVGPYRLVVADPDAGQIAILQTAEEDTNNPDEGSAIYLALRLKVEDDLITEVEQIVTRSADAAGRINATGGPRAAFFETTPEDRRMSRADLIATANMYFTGMQANDGLGDYPFADDCDRFENGFQTTNAPTPEGETRPNPATANNYSSQWTCAEQFESGLLHFVNRIRDRRFVAVDQERGIVFSIIFFDHMAGDTRTATLPDGRVHTGGPTRPWTWYIAEVFKVEDGLLHEIEALLVEPPYGMISGWSTWEDGMSDRARDVTGYEAR